MSIAKDSLFSNTKSTTLTSEEEEEEEEVHRGILGKFRKYKFLWAGGHVPRIKGNWENSMPPSQAASS